MTETLVQIFVPLATALCALFFIALMIVFAVMETVNFTKFIYTKVWRK